MRFLRAAFRDLAMFLKKCHFYLGFTLTEDSVQPTPETVSVEAADLVEEAMPAPHPGPVFWLGELCNAFEQNLWSLPKEYIQ